MTENLLDLSGKVDPTIVGAIAAVSETAERFGFPFLIVGAAARDFLLEYACGIRSGRTTEDIDFGVRVSTWEEYEQLVNELIASAGFFRFKARPHRLRAPNGLLMDLIPFGPVAGSGQIVTWPNEEDGQMNVEGFASVMSNAVQILLRQDPRLVVRTASLPGLAFLKVLSWHDAYPRRARDGFDFYVIVKTYADAVSYDRLFDEVGDLLAGPNPDVEKSGAQLLGRDMARIADLSTAERVADILRREEDAEGELRLLQAMVRAAGSFANQDDVLELLRAVGRGFSEVRQRRQQ